MMAIMFKVQSIVRARERKASEIVC